MTKDLNKQIEQAMEQARLFYLDNGFLDITRFAEFFKKIHFKNYHLRLNAIIKNYLKLCEELKIERNRKGV